jgi:hypothetical protein
MRTGNDFLVYDIIWAWNNTWSTNQKKLFTHKDNFPSMQIIGEEETTSASSRFNVEELITFLRISGQMATINPIAESDLLGLYGMAIDKKLMSRYGYRRHELQNPLLNFQQYLPGPNNKVYKYTDLLAKAMLQYVNGELYTTTRSIIFRPEIKLARPTLLPYDNEIFYVQSIAHNISINGDATTTVNANFGRKVKEPPFDLMNYMLMGEKVYQLGKRSEHIPVLKANPTPAEVQEFYAENFELNQIPFVDWLDDLDKLALSYDDYEKIKANELATKKIQTDTTKRNLADLYLEDL